jgi:hypothetical protein
MNAVLSEALVQRCANPFLNESERRSSERHLCSLEATSQVAESAQTVSWGAVVNDISPGGLNLTLCYPFRLGTFLSIDLQSANGMVRSLMVRVVHVHDRKDGMWRLGCEFLKPLSDDDIELIV